MEKRLIYADNAATTKLDKRALKAMLSYLSKEYGNPSSQYSLAIRSRKAITEAREKIAMVIGANVEEIFFTSGGTESDNWALKGTAFANQNKGNHIVVSAIEHHAVLHTCKTLEKHGFIITVVPVNGEGFIDLTELQNALRDDTILVSIMLANNEIGTIQRIQEISSILKPRGILFHTDAVQAVGHIPIDVKQLGVDLLSASGHKFNGPKGVGFLYIKSGISIEVYMDGGDQEMHNRASTENVAGIVGMATALENNLLKIDDNMSHLLELQKYTISRLNAKIPTMRINGSVTQRLPGNVNISLHNANGEGLLHMLDLKGICVSAGSACNSNKNEVSHVIRAINVPEEYAEGTLRITYGKENTLEEADKIVETIVQLYEKFCLS
jgi:cysteine desulfurase